MPQPHDDHKLTDAQQAELARNLWDQGQMSLQEIASRLRVDVAAVARMLVPISVVGDLAGDTHRQRASHQRRLLAALAVELRGSADRAPYGAIAEYARRLGVSATTVRDYLWDPALTKRPPIRRRAAQRGSQCPTCGAKTWRRPDGTSAPCSRHRGDAKPTTLTWATAEAQLHGFADAYGHIPTTTDLDPARARKRGPEYVARLQAHPVPSPNQLRRLWRRRQEDRNRELKQDLPITGGAREALAEIFASHPLLARRQQR